MPQNRQLRDDLQRITDIYIGDNTGRQIELIAKLSKHFPHVIRLLGNSPGDKLMDEQSSAIQFEDVPLDVTAREYKTVCPKIAMFSGKAVYILGSQQLDEARRMGRGPRIDPELYRVLQQKIQFLDNTAARMLLPEDTSPTTMKNRILRVATELGIPVTIRKVPGDLPLGASAGTGRNW